LQTLGFPVQAPPPVQATQLPEPLQTMLVPQLVPPALLLPSTQTGAPDEQAIMPFLQALFGLVEQAWPAVQATQAPEPLQTMFVPQLVPPALLPPSTQVTAPLEHELVPILQMLGLVEQAWPAVQATQVPEPLQTMLVPQPTPGDLLVSSTHVIAPVAQEVAPFLQALGLPVQEMPTVQATHVPEPLQTMLAPQPVPPAFGVPFTHVDAPVEHDAMPLEQGFGLPEQLAPAVHVPQNPLPSQTWFVPHGVPPMTLAVPSTQVGAPVVHERMPLLHADGLPPHAPPAAHVTQLPVPSQTMPAPQAVPGDFIPPSEQVSTPVLHEVTPLRHAGWGLVLHPRPAVQSAHWPLALHTWLVPQPVPGAFAVPSTHVCAPVPQEVTPLKHAFGLPVQACPPVHATHAPLPSQTWLAPQAVPADRLPKSRQTAAPVWQLVMPVLHAVGLVEQFAFAEHATQVPDPLQAMLVPQPVPPGLLTSSTQLWTPVAQEVMPVLHAFALVVHDWPAAHATHAPAPSQTMPTPQLVPAVVFVPSVQVVVLPLHAVFPCLHALALPVQLWFATQAPQNPLPSHI